MPLPAIPFSLRRVLNFRLWATLLSCAHLPAREAVPLVTGWQFHLGDLAGPEAAATKSSRWIDVVVPHDWSIQHPTDPDASSAGGGGFFATGIGWYQQRFSAPAHWRGQRVEVEFEGVYRRAEVWLNGQPLGRHAYGYTPFRFDLTPHLRLGEENTVLVRVDNSAQPNSRWYTGSGIYRPVTLHVTDPLRVAPHSLWAYVTDRFEEAVTVGVDLELENTGEASAATSVDLTIADPAGLPVATTRVPAMVPSHGRMPLHAKLAVPHPRLWSPKSPELYRVVARVYDGNRLADREKTVLGLRTVEISAAAGLQLNGEPVELVGANVHHDHGPLGAASYPAAEERKVRLLKAAGFNAIRTAHNPPSSAFLAACDRLGLLVVDEAFDGWAKRKLKQDYSTDFAENWRRDLETLVRRDRAHPSVILWSIGNEMYERGAESGPVLARQMRECIRQLDTTRPITAGVNGLGATGDWTRLDPLFAALDVAGYNYELARHEEDHVRLPQRVIVGAESYRRDAFTTWQVAARHPYVIGDFVWAGQDYLGEAGIGRVFPPGEKPFPHWEGSHYPWHGAATGDLDLLGHRRPISHYRNIVWDRGEKLYVAVQAPAPEGGEWNLTAWATPPLQAHWTWPGHEGTPLQVEVYSRHPKVRLYLNDALIGEKSATETEEFRATFKVPYAPGTLRAVGVDDAHEETFSLTTTGPVAQLELTPEVSTLVANHTDLVYFAVTARDAAGCWVPHASAPVTYSLDGPGDIIAIGNADLTSRETYQANPRSLYEGRSMVVVRTRGTPGTLTLAAEAAELRATSQPVNVRPGSAP